jgi:hypothetical protein
MTMPGKIRVIFGAAYQRAVSGFIVVGFIQAPLQTGFFLCQAGATSYHEILLELWHGANFSHIQILSHALFLLVFYFSLHLPLLTFR